METLSNIQVNHQIKHRFFDNLNVNNHVLSVYIGRDEISYAIINYEDHVVVFLKSYRLREINNFFAYKLLVKECLEQEELFNREFKKINVGINAADFTLVPHDFFDSQKMEEYHRFNHHTEGNLEYFFDVIDEPKIVNIFGVESYLLDTFESTLGIFDIKHSQTHLIQEVLKTSSMVEGRKIYINLQRNHVDVVGIYRYKLLIANSYQYENGEHLLYQTLNAAKHIGFDFENDTCVLIGDIGVDDKTYQLLSKYIQHLEFGERPSLVKYCSELDVIPNHYHFNLFCIS
ncbi:MAG: DUF3822 family protein [Chitinophagales bacterium]